MKVVRWLALGSTMLLAACGGGASEQGGSGGSGGEAPAASPVSLRMVDNAYEPASLTVDAAQEVELVNEGAAPHTFSIEGAEIDVEVAAGQTGTATLDLDPGTYTMFCTFHRGQGMEGTVTVR